MQSWATRVERFGNRLPDPATLFALAAAGVLLLSAVGESLGWAAADPARPGEVLAVRSLLAVPEQQRLWTGAVRAFLDFQPLGVVLVALLGVGLADKSGLLAAGLRALILASPRQLLVPGTVLAGVLSSVAADAGYVVLPPLAAAAFVQAGRSPLQGIAAVTFGIAGGFSANLSLTALDPLLAGLTEQAARLVDPAAAVRADCNWYFMAASTLLLTGVGWWVARRGGAVVADGAPAPAALTPVERRGLIGALISGLLTLGALAALVGVPGAPLNGLWERAPGRWGPVWADALVPMLVLAFGAPAVVFGILTGQVKSDRDLTRWMAAALGELGSYLVLAFAAGQFLAWFSRSNLGAWLALEGVGALSGWGLPGGLLLLAVVGLSAGLNLVMVSASAKWALLAPVLVPLLLGLGVPAEATQAAYRVGDSLTNPISPLNPYLPLVLVSLRRYAPEAGLGTLAAALLPFVLWAAPLWVSLLLVWTALGWPLGPG